MRWILRLGPPLLSCLLVTLPFAPTAEAAAPRLLMVYGGHCRGRRA